MALGDFAQSIVSLVPKVERMRTELDELSVQLRAVETRVAKLEGHADLTAERARNAALQATIEVTQRLSEKMGQLEQRVSGGMSEGGRIQGE